MTTVHNTVADAALIILGETLAAAIAAERVAIAALEASGDIENNAALDAACAPANGIIAQIEKHEPSTLMGFFVRDLAHRYVNGTMPADLDRA